MSNDSVPLALSYLLTGMGSRLVKVSIGKLRTIFYSFGRGESNWKNLSFVQSIKRTWPFLSQVEKLLNIAAQIHLEVGIGSGWLFDAMFLSHLRP